MTRRFAPFIAPSPRFPSLKAGVVAAALAMGCDGDDTTPDAADMNDASETSDTFIAPQPPPQDTEDTDFIAPQPPPDDTIDMDFIPPQPPPDDTIDMDFIPPQPPPQDTDDGPEDTEDTSDVVPPQPPPQPPPRER